MRLLLSAKANEVLRIHHQFHEEMVDSCIVDLELEKEEVMIESLEKILNYFRSELEKNEKPAPAGIQEKSENGRSGLDEFQAES